MINQGKILKPVTVTDIQNILGTTVRNVVALCRHSAINVRSLHKPYNFGGLRHEVLTDDEIKAQSCGMTPTLIAYGANGTEQKPSAALWRQADKPSGVFPTNPCRMGDFVGYDHNAKEDIASLEVKSGADAGGRIRLKGDGHTGDAPLTATLTFADGQDSRVHVNDVKSGGTSLATMYLTILAGSQADTMGTSRRWMAAQSAQPLSVRDGSGDVFTATLDIEGVDLSTFFGTDNGRHFVAVGLAPAMSGLSDAQGKAVIHTDSLPQLVSLSMFTLASKSVAYYPTPSYSAAQPYTYFDVVGQLRVIGNNTKVDRTASGISVDIDCTIAASVTSTSDAPASAGRLKLVIYVMASDSTGIILDKEYQYVTDPAGLYNAQVGITHNAVPNGGVIGSPTGTGFPSDGKIEAATTDTNVHVIVGVYAEPAPSTVDGTDYMPRFTIPSNWEKIILEQDI